MSTPITVGTTAIIAVNSNRNRVAVRFQNVGTTTLFFTRQFTLTPNIPSVTNFEFEIVPGTLAEINEAVITTNSTAQFNVVSSAAGGSLAIFETVRV